jgi:drug/metabolite transporter (DMT)-like permease
VGTALCYGIASVLQSAAAADAVPVARLDPRLLVALARTWRYPAGLALDGVGFVLSLVALRSLPLYVVQSVAASFLAVTAVAGVVLVGLRMRRLEAGALVVVVVGLTLVGLSAAPQATDGIGTAAQWALLLAAALLVLATAGLGRLVGGGTARVLGGVAGLGFGVVAVAARGLSASATGHGMGGDLRALAASPGSYAVLLATPLALVAYATALQRGTVVQATAPLVVGETVLPALAGLAVLGDHPRAGWGAPAVAGFVLAVGASIVLSRFGEVDAAQDAACQEIEGPSSG